MKAGSHKRLVRNLRREEELTRSEKDALVFALHLHDVLDGAGILTNRVVRRRTMQALVAKRFAVEDALAVVDGDGFRLEPERWRQGYRLTDAGLAVARRVYAKDTAAWSGA